MYQDAEAHSAAVRREIDAELAQKYRQGRAEHGGELWRKTGLLAHAIEEAHDLETYLVTLRQQIPLLAHQIVFCLSARQAGAEAKVIEGVLRDWLLEKHK
jgi:hypothetical protein